MLTIKLIWLFWHNHSISELSINEHTVLVLLPFIHCSIQYVMHVGLCSSGSVSHIHNPITTFNTERKTKFRFQEGLLCKHFSWKWRQLMTHYCWQTHLLAELVLPSTTAWSASSAHCYHNLTQHHYDFILYTYVCNVYL
jgi:hypothetical protein